YVADQQISAGYMHSGYPIMTHLDAAEDMVSAENLLKGTWGLFHELGHNHQVSDWTFDGTGEVTVNLFSLFIMERVCGKPMNSGHGALDERARLVAKHKAKGAAFESWKSDPFLALVMYQQLREAFGWETYQRVFAEYRGLKKDERPKGEQAERDQWMVRFSRACGKNLGPFFQAWGVPTSDEARASIADLPGWMPPDWPGSGG
ncbi:MAG: M60 family metallopeptidase, partial [Phycisphaerales bacterium]